MNTRQFAAIGSLLSRSMGDLCAIMREFKREGRSAGAAKLDRAADLIQEVLDEMDKDDFRKSLS